MRSDRGYDMMLNTSIQSPIGIDNDCHATEPI